MELVSADAHQGLKRAITTRVGGFAGDGWQKLRTRVLKIPGEIYRLRAKRQTGLFPSQHPLNAPQEAAAKPPRLICSPVRTRWVSLRSTNKKLTVVIDRTGQSRIGDAATDT